MINRPTIVLAIAICTFATHMFVASPTLARCSSDQLAAGTSSRQAKQKALHSIPYQELTRATQNKLAAVLENPSIYRRLPITSIDVDPDMFLFLARYPEVVVNIWQLMGVTKMTIERTGQFNLRSDDGAGALSNVELVYGTANKNIYYAEGNYAGPLLRRKLKGRAVIILQTNYGRDAEGNPQATNSLDVFLKVENATASLIAKTLNPIVGPTADHNFVETLKFVQRLNETTEKNGTGVQRMAYRLTNLNDNVRDRFIEIAGDVYQRSAQTAGHGRYSAAKQPTQAPTSQRSSTIPTQIPLGYSHGQRNVRPATYQQPFRDFFSQKR